MPTKLLNKNLKRKKEPRPGDYINDPPGTISTKYLEYLADSQGRPLAYQEDAEHKAFMRNLSTDMNRKNLSTDMKRKEEIIGRDLSDEEISMLRRRESKNPERERLKKLSKRASPNTLNSLFSRAGMQTRRKCRRISRSRSLQRRVRTKSRTKSRT